MRESGTDKGGRGVQNPENFADVIYVRPLVVDIPKTFPISNSKITKMSKTASLLHLVKIRRCRSSSCLLSPAQQPSRHHPRRHRPSDRGREGAERAAVQTIRVRPPSSPTHHARYFLKIWNQTTRQTDAPRRRRRRWRWRRHGFAKERKVAHAEGGVVQEGLI